MMAFASLGVAASAQAVVRSAVLETAAFATADPSPALNAPFLFAGVSGALAVASALAAAALWRRSKRLQSQLSRIDSFAEADPTGERAFYVRANGLAPASSAAAHFAERLRGDVDAPQSSSAGTPAARGGATAPQVDLSTFLSAADAAALDPLVNALRIQGTPFERRAVRMDGALWRWRGETRGGDAVLRLIPEDVEAAPARAADFPDVSRPRDTLATKDDATAPPAADAQAALAAAPGGVLVFSAERRLITANATAQRLLRLQAEWSASAPTLRAFLDILSLRQRMPEQVDYPAWRAEALIDPVAALRASNRWALPNGDVLRIAAATTPSGGFALFVDDETSALSLERRYNTAMGARRATIDAIDQGLAVVGTEGRLQLLNPAFQSIWNVRSDGDATADAPQTLAELSAAAAATVEDAELWRRIASAALPGDGPRRAATFSIERQRPIPADSSLAGDPIQSLEIRVTPLPDGAALIACADISAARRVERILREKAEALEAVEQLRADFLTDIAYHLRTPLNAVMGFADMLSQDMAEPLAPRQKTYVSYILEASNDLRELVSDALDLGALKAGSLDLAEEDFDLAAVARSAASINAKKAERAGARFDAVIDAAPLPCRGDRRRIRHALQSALAAALNGAGPGDQVALTARRTNALNGGASEPETAEVTLTLVRASRAPRGAEARARRASQKEAATLGLSLARRIVEAHGGAAEVFEEDGAMTASLRLPLLAVGDDLSTGGPEAEVDRAWRTAEAATAEGARRDAAGYGASGPDKARRAAPRPRDL